jgi:hypothetical protein
VVGTADPILKGQWDEIPGVVHPATVNLAGHRAQHFTHKEPTKALSAKWRKSVLGVAPCVSGRVH